MKKRSSIPIFRWIAVFAGLAALWIGASFYRQQRSARQLKEIQKVRDEYRQTRDHHKALEAFRAITPYFREQVDLWVEQSSLAAQTGETKTALDSLAHLETLQLQDSDRHQMAMTYQQLEKYDRTLAILNEMLSRKPEAARWIKDRGVCHYLLGQNERAKKDFLEAIRLKPGLISAHLSLGALYEKEGRRKKAKELYRLAIRQQPELGEEEFMDSLRAQARKP